MDKYQNKKNEIANSLLKSKIKAIMTNNIAWIYNYDNKTKDGDFDLLKGLSRSSYNRIIEKVYNDLRRNYNYQITLIKDDEKVIGTDISFVKRLTQEEKYNIYKVLGDLLKHKHLPEYIRYSENPYIDIEEIIDYNGEDNLLQKEIMNLISKNINLTGYKEIDYIRISSVYLNAIDFINDCYIPKDTNPRERFNNLKI